MYHNSWRAGSLSVFNFSSMSKALITKLTTHFQLLKNLICALVLSVCRADCSEEGMTCVELERSIVSQHKALACGHFKFEVVSEKSGVKRAATVEVLFSGADKKRGNMVRDETPSNNNRIEEISCFGCYGVDDHVWYSSRLRSNTGEKLVMIRDMKWIDPSFYPVPDPRICGVWVSPFFTNATMSFGKLESAIEESVPRILADVEAATLNGIGCKFFQYDMAKNDTDMKVWFAPSMGGSVLRRESRYLRKDTGVLMESKIDYGVERISNTDVWYPSRIHYQRNVDGVTQENETVNVTVISVNETLDPSVFSMAGIREIPVGAPVIRMGKDKIDEENAILQYWDGHDVVRPSILTRFAARESSWRFSLMWMNAGILLLLGTVLLFKRFRRGRI